MNFSIELLNSTTHLRPHVFSSVHSNASHTNIHQVVQVTGHCIAHVIQSAVQVSQTDQVAVAHVVGVSVVVDIS